MMQLSNCCLEDLKTWSNCNVGWEDIPLAIVQWKEEVFIVVLVSMHLTECHRMAIPPGHLNFIEMAETGHRLSLFKGLPVQLRM